MKIPGKFPKNNLFSKISNLNQSQKGLIKDSLNQKGVVSVDLKKLIYKKSKKTFSTRFINYVEPYEISGVRYTLFYTEVDHNLSKGDRVFIVGGNYDSDLIIRVNPFNSKSDGYLVQYVDRTKVVLDIEWINITPWEEEPIDNFIKVYVASSQDEFDFLWKSVSYRGTILVNYQGTDQPFLANKFAYDPITGNSMGNVLFSNGTFDTIEINDDSISGNPTYSYTFNILEVDPTSTGALTTGNILDVTSDVLSGNYTNFNNMSNGLFKIIGGSFELNGTSFQEGYIYYFDVSDSKFKVKREYSQPFITEQNFRNGRFKKGNFNQGLLGDNLNKIEYYGDNFDFKLGTIVNVNWNSGDIESGEGNVLSHNTSYDGISQPNIKISGNNNSGYGYNYAFNTNFLNGSSLNGNFFNSTFGASSNSNVIYNDIQSMSLTYSFYANGGNYYGSTFNYSKITKSLIGNSKINNTVIDLSKSVNSELSRTLFNNSKFISDKIIKIQKYSEHVISRIDLTSSNSIQKYKLYKFYINENDFLTRLSNFDSIYFDVSVSGTDSDLFNFFDDKFTIGEYTLSFDETTGKSSKKIIVQLSTKEDNKYVPYQVDLDVPYQTDTLLESNPNYGLPSIDIMYTDYGQSFLGKYYTYIEVGTWLSSPFNYPVPFAFSSFYINSGLNPPYTLSNGLSINLGDDIYDIVGYLSTLTGENWLYDPILKVLYLYSDQPSIVDSIFISSSGSPIYIKESIKSTTPKLDIINGYIIDSDFKSGLFKNSNWVSGNYMNYNKDYSLSTDTLGYYLTSSIATSSGYPMITLSIKDQLRYDLIENGDMVFMNGLHYDTTLNGGDNLVRLNDSYLVNGFTTSTPDRSIEIIDILGTQSLLNNVPSFTNQNYLITKNAENNYNYLHPVKFQNSKIESGIFRRSYFSGCEFINQTFNNLDKDILPGNVRKLLVSDSIFDDSSNIIKSGLFRHSSFISGSDIWQNGILYNSIWNRDSYTYSISATGSSILTITESSFNNGIVKNSRWVHGQFDNGQFISNKTNQTGTSSVYDDSIPTHWRKNFETRYSWIDGEFNGGQFELSNWENGEFNNGEFFNSTFMSGEATGGLFGRRNIPFILTKILSGSFSNVEVINAEFRSQDPSGQISATFSIDWHSGKFNSGLFGVKIVDQEYSNLEESYPYTSTWYGGDFNGGDFTDISKWIDGKFNGGKFTSYYGMPYTPIYQYRISNSDRFAWVGGEFNGGEFGNFSTDLNSTWYDGEFNGGIFAGRYWRNGVFTKGSFIGSGTSSTKLSNVSNYISDYSDYFYGLWEGGNVTELKESVILGKKFYTKIEREFSKKKKKPEVNFSGILWMGGTFSHNDGLIDNSVWLDGSFEKGIFRNSSFNPYVNYLTNDSLNSLSDWEIVYGSSGSNVSNYSSNIEWSGTSSTTVIYQTAGLIAGDQYTANFKINSIINSTIRYGNWISPVDGNFNSIGNWETYSNGTSTASIISGYPGYAILSDNSGPTDYCLLYQEGILESNKIYSILFYYNGAPLGTNIEVGTMDSGDENTFSPDLIVGISGYGTLSGTFSSVYTDLAIRYSSSTLLSGTQITGIVVTENYSLVSTGPYPQEISLSFTASGPNFALEFLSDGVPGISGPSWLDGSASIEFIEVIRGESGFNTSPNCIWKNGLFDNSEFFFSKWLNGKWLNGTGYGMIWENGISNYMNAYNIYWGGGLWRNGNWNGSPFNLGNIVGSQSFVSSGFASDILTNISLYRKEIGDIEYQNVFINNAFTQSSISQLLSDPDLDNGMGDLSNQSIKVFNTIPSSDHNWQSFPFLTLYSLSSGGWDQSISMTPDAGVQSPIGTTTQPSNILYTSISGDTDVFDGTLHQYDITIVYNAYYGPITITPSTSGPTAQAQATSRFRVKYGSSTNGGDEHIIEDQILNISNMNGSNSVFFGRTSNNTLNYTFAPTNLTGQKLLIQRILTCDPSITINILSIEINKRIVLYDHTYNNATYSIMGVNPQYGDQLELPSIEYLGGANAGGQVTIQFGNGMFESGTFSSIWENGVWNQGMRYDKNVIYFDDLKLFDGTSKPLTYKGNVSNNGSNEKSYSQNISSNKSYQEGIVSYKSSTWILSMRLSIGTLNFEDGYITFQDLSTISNKLKIGDKVSVGNIITIDINGNRRLLKDHLTIVKIENEYISLQFTSNFPIRGVEKDSQNHLIYLSKNIWLNGAFLNGKFRGIWNNGLFRGYPYITKMVDSQWIDGRFDGGRFRGITHSHITIDNSEVIYHSGLVQNFNFNDGDTLSSLTHSYNSWIDVNYHTYSAVSINNNMVLNNDLLGEYSITEFYSRPTVDILGSKSKLRNNSDFIINEFSLGHKYKEYVNYFEDIGQFEKYYNSSPTSPTMLGMNNLINDGFTWSSPNLSILSNDQQSNSGILNLEFQNLGIYFINRSLPLNKKRYSYISFDIVEQNNLDSLFLSFDTPPGYMPSVLSQRPSNSIKEYFFNKIGLNLISWQIISNAGNIKIDNLKLVETDMIPFLQLATESHVNQEIAFPLESVAPFIDYSDSNFSLIDNLNITETIFVTVPSSTSLTSAGISKTV